LLPRNTMLARPPPAPLPPRTRRLAAVGTDRLEYERNRGERSAKR
jgi:hypothetical protein